MGAVEACVEESEGSPMVGVGVLGGQMRGEKEKIRGNQWSCDGGIECGGGMTLSSSEILSK